MGFLAVQLGLNHAMCYGGGGMVDTGQPAGLFSLQLGLSHAIQWVGEGQSILPELWPFTSLDEAEPQSLLGWGEATKAGWSVGISCLYWG